MIELSTIKEKISPLIVLFVALYLATALIAGLVWFPLKKERELLHSELTELAATEQLLGGVVAQRPLLERKKRELEADLNLTRQQLPTQYDLATVLAEIRERAIGHGVRVHRLEHTPHQAVNGELSGSVPLKLELVGHGGLFPYLAELEVRLPTLKVEKVWLDYIGQEEFKLSVDARLNILLVDKASHSRWKLSPASNATLTNVALQGYGLPFERVRQFLPERIQVLGIVEGQSKGRALLLKDGEQFLVQEGERVEEALVQSITSNSVFLDVDGVFLRLRLGG